MTVSELIEKLKEYDGDARVCGYDARPGWRDDGFFAVDVKLDNDGSGDVALFFAPA